MTRAMRSGWKQTVCHIAAQRTAHGNLIDQTIPAGESNGHPPPYP